MTETRPNLEAQPEAALTPEQARVLRDLTRKLKEDYRRASAHFVIMGEVADIPARHITANLATELMMILGSLTAELTTTTPEAAGSMLAGLVKSMRERGSAKRS